MKFQVALYISLALIVGTVLALTLNIKRISSFDQRNYQALIDFEIPQEMTKYSAEQKREGATKTLILSQNGERKLGTLKSGSSSLSYQKDGAAANVIEAMKTVSLIFQEELLEDNAQLVVKVDADDALYHYNTSELSLNQASLSRYKIPGHHFPAQEELVEPFFTGNAEIVFLKLKGDEPVMKASGLKGSFP